MPGLSAADLAAAGFHWHIGLNAYRRCLGDYWLLCFPPPDSASPATVALIIDEDCLFELPAHTPADLSTAHTRALACIAQQAAESEAEDFQHLLDKHGLGGLFDECV